MAGTDEKRVWGIHTMNDPLFLNNNLIAIGWKNMDDLSLIPPTRDAYKEHYAKVYPKAKKQSLANGAGMLYRFVCEVQVGDFIIYPSKIDRQINIGTVEGNYIYNPNEDEYVQQRKVKWLKHLPRTAFSQGALYEVGSALSFSPSKITPKNICRHWRKASKARSMRRIPMIRLLLPPKALWKAQRISF